MSLLTSSKNERRAWLIYMRGSALHSPKLIAYGNEVVWFQTVWLPPGCTVIFRVAAELGLGLSLLLSPKSVENKPRRQERGCGMGG